MDFENTNFSTIIIFNTHIYGECAALMCLLIYFNSRTLLVVLRLFNYSATFIRPLARIGRFILNHNAFDAMCVFFRHVRHQSQLDFNDGCCCRIFIKYSKLHLYILFQ
jgi:hypothetical protein